jgi:hypothetical protein
VKKLVIGLLLVALMPLALLAGCAGSNGAEGDAATGNIHIEATINGLEEGEEATLCLARNTVDSDEVLLEKNIIGNGEAITVELDASMEDSYYQLVLEAPPKYFRDPKGYFFQVWQSEIVNPTGKSIVFDLIPPEAQTFRPYRDSDVEADVSDDGWLPYMLEAMISLSAPAKEGMPYMPKIEGTMSGLNPDDLWTIDICRADGCSAGCWHGMGGGKWEAGIDIDDDGEGQYYTITAEAEGYSVEPASYRVLVEDKIVYVVEDDEIGEEALHLDFHFSAE